MPPDCSRWPRTRRTNTLLVRPARARHFSARGLIVSKSLAKTIRAKKFEIRVEPISTACWRAAPKAGRAAKRRGSTHRSPPLFARIVRNGLRPHGRGLARRRTGRRALRPGAGRRLFRREHVPPRHRRLEGLPDLSGRAPAARRLQPARRAIRHAASRKPRRDRDHPRRISPQARRGAGVQGDFTPLDRQGRAADGSGPRAQRADA